MQIHTSKYSSLKALTIKFENKKQNGSQTVPVLQHASLHVYGNLHSEKAGPLELGTVITRTKNQYNFFLETKQGLYHHMDVPSNVPGNCHPPPFVTQLAHMWPT